MKSRKGKPVLRDARADDAAALAALAARSIAWWGYDDAAMSRWQAPGTGVAKPGDAVIVAELGDELAGYAAVRAGKAGDMEMFALFVDPALMRRGIGAMLLDDARRRAVRAGAARLLAIGDPNAEPFMRDMGGKPAGSRADPEVPGGRELVFAFPLQLDIRLAERADADDISELVGSLSGAFLIDPASLEDAPILRSFTPEAITRYVTGEQYRYFVARIGERIVGVAALRDDSHLFHLFVASQWQGLGFASALWHQVRDDAIDDGEARTHGAFTVNSTIRAVPVYQHFGFVPTGARVEKNGIAFVPMRLEVAKSR